MGQQEDIEMQLWAYIDGNCDGAEKQRIASLIAASENWQRTYAELSAFNRECAEGIELGQPSMRFTKNVMEAVAEVHVAPAASRYINPAVLKGLAALFIIPILAIIVYSFSIADWALASPVALPKVKLPAVPMASIFTSTFFYVVAGINVVIGLVLMDTMLRRKVKGQH